MADQFSEHKKLVKNKLFSAAVTGGTLEDYSQNVVLLPAQNLPAVNNPSGNTPTGTPLNFTPPYVDHQQFAQQQQSTPFANTAQLISTPLSTDSTNPLRASTAGDVPLSSVSLFEVAGQRKGPSTNFATTNLELNTAPLINQPTAIPSILPFGNCSNVESSSLTSNLTPAGLGTAVGGNYVTPGSIPLFQVAGGSKGVSSNYTSPTVGQHFPCEPQQQTISSLNILSLSNSESLLFTPAAPSSANPDVSNVISGNYVTLDSIPLYEVPGHNTEAASEECFTVQSSTKQQLPTVLPNPLHFSDLSNLVYTSTTTNSTNSGLATTITGNSVTLGSVSLFEVAGRKTVEYSPPTPASTNLVPEIKGATKNLYRLSGTNKLSYAQVPGLLTSARTDANTSCVLQPVSISSPNSYPGISIPPPTNFPTLNNSSFQSVESQTLQSSPSANIQASEFLKDCSKPSTSLSATNLYTFGTTSNEQGRFSVPLAVSNSPVSSTGNASSSILNPLTMAAEANDELSEMLFTDPYVNPISFSQRCRPVYHHWFFRREIENRINWQPFSMLDSLALEEAFVSPNINPETSVATDGGRYDVNLLRRERFPIYWNSAPTEVRRCSWFYKGPNEGRFTPFEESVATLLEEKYTNAFETNTWNHKIELSNGESLVMVGPDVLLLFPSSQIPVPWDNEKSQVRPKVVKRGMDEFDIDEGESEKIDHLLFLVHGIGSVCDLKFRSVEQVVDEFRSIASQLLKSHYQTSHNKGIIHRIEVLPISWHSKLHSEDTGIDTKLKNITLSSIPRLRDFTNDTLLDILLYTSPLYCQTIITSVGTELNRIFELFKSRNPLFQGRVSLGGHSLGSLILFDLLCHQNETTEDNISDEIPVSPSGKTQRLSRRISSLMFEAGSGQPQLIFPELNFQPTALFAIGSPIGMFLTIRGLDKLGDEFSFPTCSGFFNIFHPYDPVAYRIEPLINPQLAKLKPVLIPHHKGRKRMHLELKDTVSRVGADLKHKLIDSMKTTWNTLFQMGLFARQDNDESNLEGDDVRNESISHPEAVKQPYCQYVDEQRTEAHIFNKGRRIDYVLQEAPFEIFNEYIFALTSHVCYWESEDTILLILKEIYNSMGISPDGQKFLTQQIPTDDVQLPPISSGHYPTLTNANQYSAEIKNKPVQIGMDPTMPINSNTNIGPPPTAGFVRLPS